MRSTKKENMKFLNMPLLKKYLFLIFGSITEVFLLPLLVLICLIARFVKPSEKSLLIGMMHTNNLTHVAAAMRQRGYDALCIPWLVLPHEESVPYDVNFGKKFPFLYRSFPGQYLIVLCFFCWALFRFHVFIMPFRTRLLDKAAWLGFFEIPLLHLAGKKVILNTYGGDVATPRIRRREDLKYSLYDGYIIDPQYKVYNERSIARNTRRLEKQADCVISAIDHVDYLDRVDEYFHLRCLDHTSIKPKYEVSNKIPVFVHAPNHRLLKGTDQIIKAIESLNRRGFPCELKIVEKTPQHELMEIIRESDGVIDQLILGTYARLSIESMALGKPVFCYLREDLYEFNPIWKHCPIINVNPDTIEASVEAFLKLSQQARQAIGQKGRQYVETYHSLSYVGENLDRIIQEVIQS